MNQAHLFEITILAISFLSMIQAHAVLDNLYLYKRQEPEPFSLKSFITKFNSVLKWERKEMASKAIDKKYTLGAQPLIDRFSILKKKSVDGMHSG